MLIYMWRWQPGRPGRKAQEVSHSLSHITELTPRIARGALEAEWGAQTQGYVEGPNVAYRIYARSERRIVIKRTTTATRPQGLGR